MINEKSLIESMSAEDTLQMLLHYLRKGYLPVSWGRISLDEFDVKVESWIKDRQNFNLVKQIWPLVAEDDVKLRLKNLRPEILEALLVTLQDITQQELEFIKDDAMTIFALGNKSFDISFFLNLVKGAMVAVLARSIESRWDEIFAAHILEEIFVQNPFIVQELERNNTRLYSTAFIPVIEKMKSHAWLKNQPSKQRAILEKIKQNESESAKKLPGGISVHNCGLVILAPFLPVIYQRLAIATHDELIMPEKAIALLHFLERGEEDYAEFNVALQKVLCGIAVPYPINTHIHLSRDEKMEAEALLRSVIGHWNIDTDLNVQQLREFFLQRKGSLVFTKDEWHLHVGQAANDVLIQRLPWKIDSIKFSWMRNVLKTYW